MNLQVEVEIKLKAEFGRVWLKIFFFGGVVFGLVSGFLRKIRPTQLWVELSWVVATLSHTWLGGSV